MPRLCWRSRPALPLKPNLPPPPEQPPAATAPTLNVDARLVNIPVVVHDKKGALVQNLTQDNFVLQVDGHPQTIRYFNRDTDLPLTLGLLVDVSLSQRDAIDDERTASFAFLDDTLTGPATRPSSSSSPARPTCCRTSPAPSPNYRLASSNWRHQPPAATTTQPAPAPTPAPAPGAPATAPPARAAPGPPSTTRSSSPATS